MALPGLISANNLSDVASIEATWDNLGNGVQYTITGVTTITIKGKDIFALSNVRNTSTNQGNSTSTTNTQSDKPIEITLNHNIDLKTNGNIDTNQIVMALKNTDVQQGMAGALKEAIYSNGLMAPTSNKTQLMNRNINESSLT